MARKPPALAILGLLVSLVSIGVLVYRIVSMKDADKPKPVDAAVAAVANVPAEAPMPAPDTKRTIDKIHRMSRAGRDAIAAQIQAARDKARAAKAAATTGSGSGAVPSLPDDTIPLEQVKDTTLAAMKAAIPFLAECYPKAPKGTEIAALMTMYSDPDIGTVVDGSDIKDASGKALPAGVDDCLRNTIEELALPPLGTGGRVQIQYSFSFDD